MRDARIERRSRSRVRSSAASDGDSAWSASSQTDSNSTRACATCGSMRAWPRRCHSEKKRSHSSCRKRPARAACACPRPPVLLRGATLRRRRTGTGSRDTVRGGWMDTRGRRHGPAVAEPLRAPIVRRDTRGRPPARLERHASGRRGSSASASERHADMRIEFALDDEPALRHLRRAAAMVRRPRRVRDGSWTASRGPTPNSATANDARAALSASRSRIRGIDNGR
jgi:hypothetical protein